MNRSPAPHMPPANMSGGVISAISLRGVSKFFGALRANDNISLSVQQGTIHGIVGENGAGKSTLMSILYGVYQADRGEIAINGTPVQIGNSKHAISHGIGMVHQHFMLVGTFTVLENIILGAEDSVYLKHSFATARKQLTKITNKYGLHIDLDAYIDDLSVGQQQRVEILKTLYRNARILILDEPTAVLTPQETKQFFEILDALKSDGVTIVLITHKLKEIMAVTDFVSVMRHGKMVHHCATADTNTDALAHHMVGRPVVNKIPKGDFTPQQTLLSVHNVKYTDSFGVCRLHDINLQVRAGEILGIAGVSGNGQTEILQILSGMTVMDSGTVKISGISITADSPKFTDEIRNLGVCHIPEDRLRMGIVKDFTAQENMILGYQNRDIYNRGFIMDNTAILETANDLMQSFDVRPHNAHLRMGSFSGGNQQKLVIARELSASPDILLIGQPTRGVDIGAIESIHKRIISMRGRGKAIVLVSVELEEIISLSDTVAVMCQGAIVGTVTGDDINEHTIGKMMADANG